jgi:N-methylhydantoinase B
MNNQPLDPITTAVIGAGMTNAVAEMKSVVCLTAYSNLWREAGDLSCGLLSATGDLVIQGTGDIPIHLASMPMTLEGCLKRIPAATLKPGDVLLQNDPYQGNNHLPDFMMSKPIFFEGRIIGYAAVRGHFVDIGGGGPGSYSTTMPDIYAEGLRIPPVLIYKEGVINQDIIDILQVNTRNSRERLGDLRSEYAGCVTAMRRVIALCEKYGAEAIETTMRQIVDAGERLTRQAIRQIPDGVYRFEDYCDGDGISEEPIKISVKATVAGDDIEVDYTGSSAQVRGGMNAALATTISASCYAVKCLTDPENPPNSGSYRPIKVIAPLGTALNPMEPAAVVAGNHETAARIADAVIGALAPVLPNRVCAAGSGSSGVLSIGTRITSDGSIHEMLMVETHGAGQGGNIDGDGANTRRTGVGNTGNTPSEVLESSYPIQILRYEISQDGGGAGRTRGGTGIVRELRLDHDATVTITAERAKFGPYGLFGGAAAPTAKYWMKLPDDTLRVLPSKTAPMFLPKGTVIGMQAAGGGGYGPPGERPLEAIQSDLDDGYISATAARELYGVKLKREDYRTEGGWVVTGR